MSKYKIWHIAASCFIILFVMTSILLLQKNYKNNLYEDAKINLKNNSNQYSSFISKEISNNREYIESIGDLLSKILGTSLSNTSQEDIEYVSKIFININISNNLLSNLYFIDNATGKSIKSLGIEELKDMPTDLRTRDWYIKAKESKEPVMSDVYEDVNTNKPCITVSYALHKNGKFIGVIASDIFIEDINDYFVYVLNTNFSSAYLLSSNGRLLVDQNKNLLGMNFSKIEDRYLKDSSIDKDKAKNNYLSLWNRVNNNKSQYINFKNLKEEEILAYYTNIEGINYKLIVLLNNNYLNKYIKNNLFYTSFAGAFITIILLVLVNYFISKSYKINTLTGFNSRYKLLSDLKKKSNLKSVNMLFINIKNITHIKAEYGNKAVDLLIKNYAKIVRNLFARKATIYSANENEFIIVFNSSKLEEVLNYTKSYLGALQYYEFMINENKYIIESFIALIELNSKELKNVNISLPKIENIIENIKCGKESFIVSNLDLLIEEDDDEKIKLKHLENAIREGNVVPFFQPVMNIKTKEIEKYEVLMRIKDGEEYLSPYPFIILAEKYNIIEDIELTVLNKALFYKKQIDKEDKLVFAFNVSGKLLNDLSYLNKANLIINKYNVNHRNIVFEITETENIKNLNNFIKIINRFKKNNYRFSIDDFGTGYSSIYYLKNIPAYYLKIDGSFIKDINEKEENIYIVKSIINMAKAFKLKIVAEYVESKETLQTLENLDVDFVQGYYINKPSNEIIL